MVKETFRIIVPLLLLLLFVSMVSSSAAVPMSRNLKMFKDDQQQVLQDLYAQDHVMVMKTEGFVERRMEIEITDYPEPGANNHHDPGSPS